jgi:hypothetical protein
MRSQAAAAGIPCQPGGAPLHTRHPVPMSLIWVGLLLMAIGAVIDIGHHAGVPGFTVEVLRTAGHLVTLAGMVLTAVAIALVAILRRR